MAMNGYPPGATSCYIDQTTIWNYIQANNLEGGLGPWGIGWYSDPYAMTKALNDLCRPSGGWHDVSNTDKNTVLYKLLRWMASYKYPSPICIGTSDHWVLLVDYKTNDDPRVVTDTELLRIGFKDPEGYYENAPDDIFLTDSNRWGHPCNTYGCGQKWKNKYIGIGEPPAEAGRIHVRRISRIGKKLIPVESAVSIAQKFLSEFSHKRSELLLKHFKGTRPWHPMLVRELPSMQPKTEAQEGIRYYLIPFGQRYEVDSSGTSLARFAVVVNAYTGRTEGLTVFSKPVRYLEQRNALRIAKNNIRPSIRRTERIEAELVFLPLHPNVTRAQPAWRIATKERELLITQTGKVIGPYITRLFKGA